MDPVLAQIDVLLEDEELYQRIRSDFAKRYPKTAVTGRKSTPVEVMLRQFCRVYFEDVLGDAVSLRIEGASNAPTERWWRAALMHPVIVIGWQTASEAGSDNRARKTGRQVRRLVVRQKEAAQQAYTITQQRASQAKQVLEALGESSHPQAQGLKDTLETFIPRAEQVIGQTICRVFQDEKIVSIFEAHTAIIRRGRAGKPVEYGRKVWLDEVEGGIVTRWEVLDGTPSDKDQSVPGTALWQTTYSGQCRPQCFLRRQ